jgi:putative transposase
MARLSRLTAAGLPHHVLQRGHNRQAVAVDANDHLQLLAMAEEAARATGVQIHAFVLLPGALHWVLTPQGDDGVSPFMQALGRRYGRYFNARHGRSGSLWDGRFRSAVFQPEGFMLDHLILLDSLPVREGLVAHARDFAWSSAQPHVGEGGMPWLVPPPAYWALGNTPFERESRYAQAVDEGLPAQRAQQLMSAVNSGWALGDASFVAQLSAQLGRRVQAGQRGRPKRAVAAHEAKLPPLTAERPSGGSASS